jgi:hypothetical protein
VLWLLADTRYFFLFPKYPDLHFRPSKSLIQWLLGTLSPGIKRPGCGVDYSFPACEVVKNECKHVYMACTRTRFHYRSNESILISPSLRKIKGYALKVMSSKIHTYRYAQGKIYRYSYNRKQGRPQHRSGSSGVRKTCLWQKSSLAPAASS